MNANGCIGGLVTVLALLASPVDAAPKPLRMDLAPLMQRADFVTLHLAQSQATTGLIDADHLGKA